MSKNDIEKKAYDFFYKRLLYFITEEKVLFDRYDNYTLSNVVVLFIYEFSNAHYNRYTQGHNLIKVNKDIVHFKLTITDESHETHDITLCYDVKQLIRVGKIKKLKGVI